MCFGAEVMDSVTLNNNIYMLDFTIHAVVTCHYASTVHMTATIVFNLCDYSRKNVGKL